MTSVTLSKGRFKCATRESCYIASSFILINVRRAPSANYGSELILVAVIKICLALAINFGASTPGFARLTYAWPGEAPNQVLQKGSLIR